MIEIIKPGANEVPHYQYQISCVVCGCEFTFHEEDFMKTESAPFNDYRFIKCPHCGATLQFIPREKQIYPKVSNEAATIPLQGDYDGDRWVHNLIEQWAKENLPEWLFYKDGVTDLQRVTTVTPYTSSVLDFCESCPNNPGKVLTVGDSLCQWCSHNPRKLTCETVSSSTETKETK